MPTLQHDGCGLAYELHGGAGPAVLMIQGVGLGGKGWLPQVREMAAGHRLLTFDNRGVGASAGGTGSLTIERLASDAMALARAAGWESYHVVGHSMGGVIAQRVALMELMERGRVRSLSLLCTVARGRDAVRPAPRLLWAGLRTRVGSRRARRRAFLGMIYPKSVMRSGDIEALAAEASVYFERDLADQPSIIMRQAAALARHDCTGELPRLAGVPTLVVSAEEDPIAPPKFGRRLAEQIPGAEHVELPGVSHGVPIHRPGVVNELLRRHVAHAERAWAETGPG